MERRRKRETTEQESFSFQTLTISSPHVLPHQFCIPSICVLLLSGGQALPSGGFVNEQDNLPVDLSGHTIGGGVCVYLSLELTKVDRHVEFLDANI
jgi:hypothetical protein